MKYFLILTALITLTVSGHVAYKNSEIQMGNAQSGEQIYAANCLACHGVKGRGDGVLAESLPRKPKNLPKRLNDFFNYDFLMIQAVQQGREQKGMPAFQKVLTEQEVKDIFSYVRSVNF